VNNDDFFSSKKLLTDNNGTKSLRCATSGIADNLSQGQILIN